jgi:hypothetical protein
VVDDNDVRSTMRFQCDPGAKRDGCAARGPHRAGQPACAGAVRRLAPPNEMLAAPLP